MASIIAPPAAAASGAPRASLSIPSQASTSTSTSTSASSSQQNANAGPHLLSLKVMRASAPSLATSEKPYYDAGTLASDALISAMAQGIDDALSHDLLSSHLDSTVSSSAQFPISNLLVLPNSFGTLFLGETFRTYLCVRNESSTAVREPSLRVEMQVGTEDGGRWHQLAHVILPSPTRFSPDPSEPAGEHEDGRPVWELSPTQALETSLGYDIKDLGPHVLVCTVGYKQQSAEDAWVERSFRKFYKFSVDRSPISVRTKVHQPRHAISIHHPDSKVRNRVELEVQVQNVSGNGSGLVLDGLKLKCAPDWRWSSVDRPSLNARGGEDEADMWIDKGTSEVLADGDVRQYLFTLVPEREMSLVEEVAKGGADLGMTAEGLMMRGDALGCLDISWRMSLGEAGRLQTSQLVRRRVVQAPIAVSTVASQLEPQVKTRLTLQPRALETLRTVQPGDLVELDLDVTVCDVSGLALPGVSQDGAPTEAAQVTASGKDEFDDDEDDDTPLSEIASSPRAAGKRTASSSTLTATAPSSAEDLTIRRTLHLALQHCSIDAPIASVPDSASAPVPDQQPSTPRKTPLPSRTSTPTQTTPFGGGGGSSSSSSVSVGALNKARLQANLTSLVRNSSLSSLRTRGSVDEGDRGGRSTPQPPALPPKSDLSKQVSAEQQEETQEQVEKRVVPSPRIPWESIVRLYKVHLEMHSQALNRPVARQQLVVPTTFLPSPTAHPIGSTLVPLPPVSIDIPVVHAHDGLHRPSDSDNRAPPDVERTVPIQLQFSLDDVDTTEAVVRFGALRVLLLSYDDVVLGKDGKAKQEEEGEKRECMVVIDEVPVVAEALVVAQ